MKKLRVITVLLASWVLMVLVAVTVHAETYETYNLKITYENEVDLEIGLAGVKKARDFFSNLGYKSDYPVDITFKDEVTLLRSGKPERVYGIYEGETRNITISSWGTEYITNRKCFGINSSIKMHESIVSHEVGHSLLKSIAGKRGHGINEYVAYTVQLSTLDKNILNEVLKANKNVEAHEPDEYGVPRGINSFVHGVRPHKFGIMSYLHFKKYGPQIFNDIIKGVFDPDKEIDMLIPLERN